MDELVIIEGEIQELKEKLSAASIRIQQLRADMQQKDPVGLYMHFARTGEYPPYFGPLKANIGPIQDALLAEGLRPIRSIYGHRANFERKPDPSCACVYELDDQSMMLITKPAKIYCCLKCRTT